MQFSHEAATIVEAVQNVCRLGSDPVGLARTQQEGSAVAAGWKQLGELGFLDWRDIAPGGLVDGAPEPLRAVLVGVGSSLIAGPTLEAFMWLPILDAAISESQGKDVLGHARNGTSLVTIAGAAGQPGTAPIGPDSGAIESGVLRVTEPIVLANLPLVDDVVFLVRATSGDVVIACVAAADLEARPISLLDDTQPYHTIQALDVETSWTHTLPRDKFEELRERLQAGAAIASLTMVAGALGGVVDITRRYVLEREQFGQPIGGFQAVKHTMARMLASAKQAEATAGVLSGSLGTGTLPLLCAWEAIMADAVAVAESAVHLHGGMGFSAETAPHLYLKRIWAWSSVGGLRQSTVEAWGQALETHTVR